jgi:hypothetical protein
MRLRIGLLTFLTAVTLMGSGIGLAGRWLAPYRASTHFANGQTGVEWKQQRKLTGEIEVLEQEGFTYFYSNGVKSREFKATDPISDRFYSPDGVRISGSKWVDFYVRDLGDGTFAEKYPEGDRMGSPAPLAKQYK